MASKPWNRADSLKLGVVLVAGLGLGLAYRSPTVRVAIGLDQPPKPPPPAEPENTEPPIDTVKAYWALISQLKWSDAWALLTPSYQQRTHPTGLVHYRMAVARNNYCTVSVTDSSDVQVGPTKAVLSVELLIASGLDCKETKQRYRFTLTRSKPSQPWLLHRVERE